MAGGAGVGEYFRTVVEISRTAGFLDALQTGANELGAVGNSGRQPFHIGEIRLHLGPIERHDVAVHAALQATVDALPAYQSPLRARDTAETGPIRPSEAPRRSECRP